MTSPASLRSVPVQGQPTKCSRSLVALLVVTLFVSLPPQAMACDPNCDLFLFAFVATPAALGTVLVAPLVGLATDRRPNSPYWQALGFTTLAAGAGWAIGVAVTSPTGDQVSGAGSWALTAIPVLLGSAATYLTYRFWPRGEGATTSTLSRLFPTIWVAPNASGVSFGASLRL
jgi:hypothetical protein